ncbi:MAG: radical SAM protein [Chloroflexota bacterium]|nr:radical SAM protein [Chloroflexota bacterium]
MRPRDDYLLLSPSCFLKELESLCLYNVATDELYELDERAYEFLRQCDGSRRLGELEADEDFLSYCFSEGLLVLSSTPQQRAMPRGKAPQPSLRYLELQITGRCNLRCRHCYQGIGSQAHLSLAPMLSLLEEFHHLQGLRLLVSGGEPMMHPDFWRLNEALPRFAFRSILLTNGTLIGEDNAPRLRFHEVQVSLDGWEVSHDALRGRGTFKKATQAIEALRRAGIEVSVATMVHAANRGDFPRLEAFLKDRGVRAWQVDVPVLAGRLAENLPLALPYQEAASYMKYGYGGGLYSSAPGFACGSHLCAVLPEGGVAKCGFFAHEPVGGVEEGLGVCWGRLLPTRLEELECSCPYVEECCGGCRYRALLYRSLKAPDPVQCYARGLEPPD